jgi:ribosomal protein S3
LRAEIDYGHAVSKTTQGTIGTKVWVFKGEVLFSKSAAAPAKPAPRKAEGEVPA